MNRRIGIASLVWGTSILLTKVVGVVREGVVGRVLGAGADADVFWTAFVVPDFLNYLLAGSALSIVFIPIFAAHLDRGDEEAAYAALSTIANAILVLLAILLPVLWLALPALSRALAPGWSPEQQARLVLLSRIVLPAQAFHLVGGLLSATLQARDRHALPALAPLVYSGAMIVGGLVGRSAEGFAWGVVAGSVLGPFALPLAGNLRAGLRYRATLSWRHPDLRTWLWRSLPVMLGWSITAVDDWILKRQASLLAVGSVSTLQYAKTLLKVPMGMFGLATGVASYPTLTRFVAAGDRKSAYETLAASVRSMLVLVFGAQIALTLLGRDASALIYGSRVDAGQVGVALALFAVGLWAWSAQTVVARGFYALGETWAPTLLGTVLVVVTYPVYVWLRRTHGLLGLPVATSIAISAYTLLLALWLRTRYPGARDGYGAFALRIVPATAIGLAVGWALAAGLGRWAPSLVANALGTVAGGTAYLAAARWFGVGEVTAVLALVSRRVARVLPRVVPGTADGSATDERGHR